VATRRAKPRTAISTCASNITSTIRLCVKRRFDRLKTKGMPRQQLREMVEYAFDIRICGETSDTTGNTSKLAVFQSLETVYIARGSRLKEIDLTGPIDWPSIGHYSIKKAGIEQEPVTQVYSSPLDKLVVFPCELLDGISLSTADIEMNFSQWEASVQLAEGVFRLQNLFPAMGRMLRKKNSDEGAIGKNRVHLLKRGRDSEGQASAIETPRTRPRHAAEGSPSHSPGSIASWAPSSATSQDGPALPQDDEEPMEKHEEGEGEQKESGEIDFGVPPAPL